MARWQALQALAATDLVLAKLAEPHWDAQAILADCVDEGEAAVLAALPAATAAALPPFRDSARTAAQGRYQRSVGPSWRVRRSRNSSRS